MSVAADRFASLLDLAVPAIKGRTHHPAPSPSPRFKPAARLLVRDGLHSGAWMSLRGERLRVGSADDGDIVLTDPGMPALAGHFIEGADGWQFDAAPDAQQPIDPATDGTAHTACAAGESLHGRWRRRRWQLHGVTVVVIDAAAPAQTAAASATPRRLALKLSLGAAATLLAIGAVVAIARIATPSPQTRVAQALPSLQALKLPDVRLRGNDDTIELVGHVADAAQFEKLRGWLTNSSVDDARMHVQVGTALAGQVREALGNASDAKVSYTGGGHVRIEGSTRSGELKRRVQTLVTEMRESVLVDDQLALVEGKDTTPVQRTLPIRVVNVMLGDAPYFQTDTGATYFVGSTLPDGAEVMAISPLQIVFRLDQRDVIYRLDN